MRAEVSSVEGTIAGGEKLSISAIALDLSASASAGSQRKLSAQAAQVFGARLLWCFGGMRHPLHTPRLPIGFGFLSQLSHKSFINILDEFEIKHATSVQCQSPLLSQDPDLMFLVRKSLFFVRSRDNARRRGMPCVNQITDEHDRTLPNFRGEIEKTADRIMFSVLLAQSAMKAKM